MMNEKMKEQANETEAIIRLNNKNIKNMLIQALEDAIQVMAPHMN